MVMDVFRRLRSRKVELIRRRCLRSVRNKLCEALLENGACKQDPVTAGIAAQPDVRAEAGDRPGVGPTCVRLAQLNNVAVMKVERHVGLPLLSGCRAGI